MKNKIIGFFHALSEPDHEERSLWFLGLWAALLFFIGAFLWGMALNWGSGAWTYHDWGRITGPRLAFIKNSLEQGVFPLHISNPATLGGVTDRFFTVPDVPFSPQFLLLRWMELGPFVYLDVLLFYAIGLAGLVYFCRKYHLSAMTLTFMTLLFNFNGHLLCHFSAGHFTWMGYFLFPWLMVLVFELFKPQVHWAWSLSVIGVLLAMLLQGSYHQFVYSLFLLGLMVLVTPRHFWLLAKTAVFAVLAGAVRLLPPVINLGVFDNEYIAGYPSVQSIWEHLVQFDLPFDLTINQGLTDPIGVWEYSAYVGLAAAAALVFFGVVRAIQNHNEANPYAALLLPAVCLMALSLDRVYKYLRLLVPLPIFTGERAPSRIMGLVLVLVLYLAAMEFQRWWNMRSFSWLRLAAVGVTGLMIAHDLWQNIRIWGVSAAAAMFEKGDFVAFQESAWKPVQYADPLYTQILIAGGVISVLALGALVWISLITRRRQALAPA